MPINQNDHASVSPQDLAEVMAYTMNSVGTSRCLGSGGFWLLSPEHASTLSREGWTKQDVKQFLWETAKAPFSSMPALVEGTCSITSCCPEDFPEEFVEAVGQITDDTMIPVTSSPDRINLIVVGGAGKQSQWWSFGFSPEPPTIAKIDPWK